MNKEEFRKNQPVAWRVLSNALRSDRLSHAYLFSGMPGAPLRQASLLLAQSIFCEHPDEDGFACQQCLSCRQIEENSSPDVFKIGPDAPASLRPLKKKEIQEFWKNGGHLDLPEIRTENYQIRKEQIAGLQDFFSKSTASQKGRRVYILENYDRANASASNALLKFLEEPPEGVIGILTTDQLSGILETIQSRTQIISLRAAGREIRKAEILKLIDDEKAAEMLAAHGCDEQDAAKILRENRLFDMQEAAEQFLNHHASHAAILHLQLEVFPAKNRDFNRMDFQLFLYWLSDLSYGRKDLSLDQKLKIRSTCLDLQDLLKTPCDAALLLDRLCYQIRQIFS